MNQVYGAQPHPETVENNQNKPVEYGSESLFEILNQY